MGVIHGLDQEALPGVARDDGGAFFAALEQTVAVIEAEVTLLLLGVVAFVAFGDEHRPDPGLEELHVRRFELGG